MPLLTNDDWTLNGDHQYATTNDPRVIAIIERDQDYGGGHIDGDVYAPAWYFDTWREELDDAGSTFRDDASEHIMSRLADARWRFRHKRLSFDVVERWLRIFHDTTMRQVKSSIDREAQVVILNTPSWREHVGLDSYDEHILDGDVESWQAAMSGEVYGIGYAVNEDRTDPDEEIDLDDWDITVEVWGYLGETYAQNAAASFENGEPDIKPVDGPREYEVSYSIVLEADSYEGAARALAAMLSEPGVPQRGSYDVRLHGGRKVETVDLGEGEF